MKKLLVLALTLLAVNAFAQVDQEPNGVGVYFDVAATTNCAAAPGMFQPVNAYVIATNITEGSGISGWEATVHYFPAAPLYLTYVLAGTGAVNPLVAPYFSVGLPTALPFAPAIKLLTISFPYTAATGIGIGPCVPSSFDGKSPGYAAGDNPGNLIPLVPSASEPIDGVVNGFWVADVGGAILCPVATVEDSWGSVKNLYQ